MEATAGKTDVQIQEGSLYGPSRSARPPAEYSCMGARTETSRRVSQVTPIAPAADPQNQEK